MEEQHCRVCGLFIEELIWGEDGVSPIYEICHCCGVEFGYQDYTIESVKRYREQWVYNGCNWFTPKEKPDNWDYKKQLQNVAHKYL